MKKKSPSWLYLRRSLVILSGSIIVTSIILILMLALALIADSQRPSERYHQASGEFLTSMAKTDAYMTTATAQANH